MLNKNNEIYEILNFSKRTLNKKNIIHTDYVFHSSCNCNNKILILNNFKTKNIKNYIDVAIKKGIKGLILDKKVPNKILPQNLPVIFSTFLSINQNEFLSKIYSYPLKNKKIIGITGTDGKTSLSNMLAQAYTLTGKKVGIISTEGCGIYPNLRKTGYTTPRSDILFEYFHKFNKKSANIIIIESSSQGLKQGRLNNIIFDISIVTNITNDHLDYHKTHLSYIKSKCKLLDMTNKSIYLNMDCKSTDKVLSLTSSNAKIILYTEHYNITAKHKTKMLDTTTNKYNYSVIYALLKKMNVSDNKIIKIFEKIRPIAGRNNIIYKKGFAKFIIDYAHTEKSFESLLIDMNKMYAKESNRLIVIFGCGGDRDKAKRIKMGSIAAQYCDTIILTDDNPRTEESMDIINSIHRGIPNSIKVHKIPNRKIAIKKALKISNMNDIVVIAGKGNEQSIDYGSKTIEHNDIKYLKNLLHES